MFYRRINILCSDVHSADLGQLIDYTRSIMDVFSKAKAAKLIRELVDQFLDMDTSTGKEVVMIVACYEKGLYCESPLSSLSFPPSLSLSSSSSSSSS